MQQLQLLEQKIDDYTGALAKADVADSKRSQSNLQEIAGFQESSWAGIAGLTVGAAFAGPIGGILNNLFPLGTLAVPLAGFLIRHFVKSGFFHNVGTGVLVAGLAVFLSGLTGGLMGSLGGQRAAGGSAMGADGVRVVA